MNNFLVSHMRCHSILKSCCSLGFVFSCDDDNMCCNNLLLYDTTTIQVWIFFFCSCCSCFVSYVAVDIPSMEHIMYFMLSSWFDSSRVVKTIEQQCSRLLAAFIQFKSRRLCFLSLVLCFLGLKFNSQAVIIKSVRWDGIMTRVLFLNNFSCRWLDLV